MSLLLLVLTGCGPDIKLCLVDNITSGICIIDNGLDVPLSDVDITVKVLEEKMKARYPEVDNLPKAFANMGVRVNFLDEDLAVDCNRADPDYEVYECQNIGGVNFLPDHEIFVQYRKCLASSALAHELMHSLEYSVLDVGINEDHDTPWLFQLNAPNTPGGISNTVEFQVWNDTIREHESCAYIFEEVE